MLAWWGILNIVVYKEAPAWDPTPYPFIYHFWQKRYPFHIPSTDKINGAPFTYPVKNVVSLLTAVDTLSFKYELQIKKQNVFSTFSQP